MSSLNIALLQLDIAWLQPQKNLQRIEFIINQEVMGADLIILPETFANGFAFDQVAVSEEENGPIFQWMHDMAQHSGSVIVGSVAVKFKDKQVNRMYWVTPQGTYQYYDKRHLFRMGKEHHHVYAGQERRVFELKGFRLLPSICYDLRFPVWLRNQNEYDVLLNVANWPGIRRKAWDTLLPARAIENQCYVVAVNRVGKDGKGVSHSGGTAIYDFKGDVLISAMDQQAQVLQYSLELDALKQYKRHFPAHLDADQFHLEGINDSIKDQIF